MTKELLPPPKWEIMWLWKVEYHILHTHLPWSNSLLRDIPHSILPWKDVLMMLLAQIFGPNASFWKTPVGQAITSFGTCGISIKIEEECR